PLRQESEAPRPYLRDRVLGPGGRDLGLGRSGRSLGFGRGRAGGDFVGDHSEHYGAADLDLLERIERLDPVGQGLGKLALEHLANELNGRVVAACSFSTSTILCRS